MIAIFPHSIGIIHWFVDHKWHLLGDTVVVLVKNGLGVFLPEICYKFPSKEKYSPGIILVCILIPVTKLVAMQT